MFDVGWSEMAIIAVVTLVVLGPKELPHALKTFSHWMRAARKLGNEFQSGVNEIVRDAELEDTRRELQKISRQSLEQKIEKAIDPAGDIKKAMNAPFEAPVATASCDAVPEVLASLPDPPATAPTPSLEPDAVPAALDKATGNTATGDTATGEAAGDNGGAAIAGKSLSA